MTGLSGPNDMELILGISFVTECFDKSRYSFINRVKERFLPAMSTVRIIQSFF